MNRYSEKETNTALLAEIHAHFAAVPVRTAYVVPLSKLYKQPQDTNEWCIVVPMPGKAATEIDCEDRTVSTQIRLRRDGDRVECLLVAGRRVAVWGAAVNRARSHDFGRVSILWVFDDAQKLIEYPIDEQVYEDLWVAQQAAQSHMHSVEGDEEAPNRDDVFEYLECIVFA